MKRILSYYSCAVLILIIAGTALFFSARAQEGSPAVAPEGVPTAFTLLIVGTRHYSDITVMEKNIRRIPKMQRLVQTVSNQNHVQFTGTYSGDADSLLADIQGLAADRFEVQSRDDRARGLVITLRKIQADDAEPQ